MRSSPDLQLATAAVVDDGNARYPAQSGRGPSDHGPAGDASSGKTVSDPGPSDPGMGFYPFVALIAAIMACNALGIDSMLAALPAIGHSLGIASENDRQWIIAIYVFGFGAAQLVYGPLADRYGRRPILIVSMALFALLSIVAGLATSFTAMLVARLLEGIAGAAGRVLVVSIVRDCYQGRQMARVMSLSFIVFLAVPVFAPSIGQLILLFADWRFIFFFLAAFAGAVALVGGLRLKETLHPAYRRQISFGGVTSAVRETLSERNAVGYTIASTLVFGSLMGFINSVQQVFTDIFHEPQLFPVIFACIAGAMGLAAFLNSHLVERLGTRFISHWALIGFIACASLHVAIAVAGRETLVTLSIIQCLTMFCFGLMGSNFGSMAMEAVGDIAGTASSVQGFISTCGGALIGIVIGQAFDGTTLPLALGFLVVGIAALVVVVVTERGRLFQAHQVATA